MVIYILKKNIIPFKSKCIIVSHSHILNKEAFSFLMRGNRPLIVSDVKEKSFLLTVTNKSSNCIDINHFIALSHFNILTFITALNIACLGYFTWDWFGFSMPRYEVANPITEKKILAFPLQMEYRKEDFKGSIKEITEKEIRNALLYFGVLTKDKEEKISIIREEYVKGLLHLSLAFFNMDFYREAFFNFYRCFENIVTNKVLQVKKLDVELKNIENAINKVGLGKILARHLKPIYKTRSNQVMHAQKDQINVTMDDAFMIKTSLDALLFKVFSPILEKALKRYRELKEE